MNSEDLDYFLVGRSLWRLDKSERSALRRLSHADANEKHYISHIGMYIGTDSNGNARFLSSRQIVNGRRSAPTTKSCRKVACRS